MLDLKEAVGLARTRIESRLALAAQNQKSSITKSARIIQQGASFRAHLLEAFRRSGDERTSPSPAPDALFLAFPEKVLGKWHHMAYGPQRQSKGPTKKPSKDIEVWEGWDELGSKTKVTNFVTTKPQAILIAHGLSAIEDSILLLADIGRASRASRAIGKSLHALLADVSWIKYNRSIRQFGLSEKDIESGLRSCHATRQRIYEGSGINVKSHAIVPYTKKGAISAQKIQLISEHYLQLVSNLWGPDKISIEAPLSRKEVSLISKSIELSLSDDSPLQFLAGFPGALNSLEMALGNHLDVVRTIARQFNFFNVDVFSYYFAQYYAQDEYRGTHIKVAPVSEIKFDEPYDKLDKSFRLWGDGHEPNVNEMSKKISRKKRMAAVYLPQYYIGAWKLLPYSPLSLDSVEKSAGDIDKVREKVILLSDYKKAHLPKVESLLRLTLEHKGVIELNRLLVDIISFIQTITIEHSKGLVDSAFRCIDGNLDSNLAIIHDCLPEYFSIECEDQSRTSELWLSWLDAVGRGEDISYVPCHLLISCLSTSDWTDERFIASSVIVTASNKLANDFAS